MSDTPTNDRKTRHQRPASQATDPKLSASSPLTLGSCARAEFANISAKSWSSRSPSREGMAYNLFASDVLESSPASASVAICLSKGGGGGGAHEDPGEQAPTTFAMG